MKERNERKVWNTAEIIELMSAMARLEPDECCQANDVAETGKEWAVLSKLTGGQMERLISVDDIEEVLSYSLEMADEVECAFSVLDCELLGARATKQSTPKIEIEYASLKRQMASYLSRCYAQAAVDAKKRAESLKKIVKVLERSEGAIE